MAIKFRVGEVVRCIRNSAYFSYVKGGLYTVKAVTGNSITTEFDSHGSPDNGWSSCNFERIQQSKKRCSAKWL